MDYKQKYLKYKNKYLDLLNKQSKLPQLQTGSAIPDFENIKYIINFLWMNKTLPTMQNYIIPINVVDYDGTRLPDLSALSNYINIANWCRDNPEAQIYFWHEFAEEEPIIANTKKLICFFYSNPGLSKLIQDIYPIYNLVKVIDPFYWPSSKIIKFLKNPNLKFEGLDKYYKFKLSEKKYLSEKEEEEISKYIRISSFEFTDKFREDLEQINQQIRFNESTQLIEIPSGLSEIPNIQFHSILNLLIWKEKEFADVNMLDNFVINKSDPEHYILPVYFRVDLVRLIILLELAKSHPDYYLIYGDVDSIALTKEKIFTKNVTDLLTEYGLVLPPSKIGVPYENSFHILAGQDVTNDKYMLDSIKLMLVYFNLYKIIYSIETDNFKDDIRNKTKNSLINDPENVYDDYRLLFNYYFARKDKISVKDYYGETIKPEELDSFTIKKSNLFADIIVNEIQLHPTKNSYFLLGGQDQFSKIKSRIPVSQNLDISPHGYSYSKKYIKLK
jgi:hypothetical protein